MSIKVFCFPFAGGSDSYFDKWRGACHELNVHPVNYPGRGKSYGAELCQNMDQLLDQLFPVIQSAITGPCVFFGHSFGSVVAHAMVQRMLAERYVPPRHLYVSAKSAPSLGPLGEVLHLMPDDELVAEVIAHGGTPSEVIGNRELMQLFLPILRADFKVMETSHAHLGADIGIPITAFGGRDDHHIPLWSLEKWVDESSGPFQIRIFEGDHFYLKDAYLDILNVIRRNEAQSLRSVISMSL